MARLDLPPIFAVTVTEALPATALARVDMLDAAQPELRRWLTPTLGPTASLAFDVLWPVAIEGGFTTLEDLSWQLGVQPSMAGKALHRLLIFRCASTTGEGAIFALRRWWPNIPPDKLATAPSWWRDAHTHTFEGT